MEYAENFAKRWHRLDYIQTPKGRLLISTVFLAVDMDFFSPRPLCYETMWFKPDSPEPWDGDVLGRYASRRQAIRWHKRHLRRLARGSE